MIKNPALIIANPIKYILSKCDALYPAYIKSNENITTTKNSVIRFIFSDFI